MRHVGGRHDKLKHIGHHHQAFNTAFVKIPSANSPPKMVTVHSTSRFGLPNSFRESTIAPFQPSCWYSGIQFPIASPRFRTPNKVPHASVASIEFTPIPAPSTK